MEQTIIHVPLTDIIDPDENPNVMEPEQYELLVRAITKAGFLQPILVREPLPGELPADQEAAARLGSGRWYRIVDGYHRARAAREAGLMEVPCVVISVSEAEASILQIGMNRMRGELDLASVAKIVGALHEEGWTMPDLTLTGFSEGEVEALLASVQPDPEELADMGAVDATEHPTPEEEETSGGVLEIVFKDRKVMGKASRRLRKLGGGDLANGLLHLLEEHA